MNNTSPQYLVRGGWLQLGLLLLAAVPLSIGFWAFLAPYHFYEIFPLLGRNWISTLGPYNEHLVRDYGATNLGFGVLLAAAAVLLERHLSQVALVSWLAFALPHFIFHLTQNHHFQLFDNLTQFGSLGFVVLLPLVLLFFVKS
ncbi:MAG TPA: hypothetical protein DDZ80_28215 [Cyanobacteria bacterium UBA8803]|nr:hypothetical protein [Cyanobacteria bacterium UBA9273]HBL62148.1 hypothetical protein [Cyanobacteria bacterium UBA8803]